MEKKITSPICDDNGYEIFVTYTLVQHVTEWERDEDDIRTPVEYHFEIDTIHDIVLMFRSDMVSIMNTVSKNSVMYDNICNSLLDYAEDNWNN